MRLSEIDHSYDSTDSFLSANPIKKGDRLRVFHGFRDFPDAVSVAKHGLTGAKHAARVYSYEADNNPRGLFVTMKFDVASEFLGAYGAQAVLEMMVSADELEAPVWPSGSYTVQGQLAQYFGRGAKGRAARKQAQRDAEANTRARIQADPHFSAAHQSDRAHMAYLLLHSREHQALFVGHLNPEEIVAIHVRADYKAPWERLSRDEFLERYGDTKLDVDRDHNRVFKPNDPFNGDVFVATLKREHGDHVEESLENLWQDILLSHQPTARFVTYFEPFLWPKQYVPAMQWMRAKWGARRG